MEAIVELIKTKPIGLFNKPKVEKIVKIATIESVKGRFGLKEALNNFDHQQFVSLKHKH